MYLMNAFYERNSLRFRPSTEILHLTTASLPAPVKYGKYSLGVDLGRDIESLERPSDTQSVQK